MLVAILVVFVIIAVLLIGLVLLQNEGGNGVGGIFGGSSSSVFGSRSGNVLSKATYILGILFFVLCFVLALMNKPDRSKDAGVLEAAGEESGIEQPASEDEDWFKKAPVESEGAEAPAASTGTLETDTVIVE